jgi:hypothetical protein
VALRFPAITGRLPGASLCVQQHACPASGRMRESGGGEKRPSHHFHVSPDEHT